jgi:hypothetical protein
MFARDAAGLTAETGGEAVGNEADPEHRAD